jgi:hypothetical protein
MQIYGTAAERDASRRWFNKLFDQRIMRFEIALLLLLCATAYADDASIKIQGSKPSAKGDEMVLVPIATTIDPNEFIVLFRNAHSKDIHGADCPTQFGGQFTPSELPIKTVIWSPTGEYVAFDLRTERHNTSTVIYRLTDDVSTVTIPEYWNQLKKQLGRSAEFRGGGAVPIKWLDKNHLEIKENGLLRDERLFDFRVILELTGTMASFQSAHLQ